MAMLGSLAGMLRVTNTRTWWVSKLQARLPLTSSSSSSSLLEQRAGVCSVCASLARKAQQAQQQKHQKHQLPPDSPAQGHPQLHSLHGVHHSHSQGQGPSGKRLLVPNSRLARHTITSHFFRTTTHSLGQGESWGYNGTHSVDLWRKDFPDCNGKAQSPVDIVTYESLKDKDLVPFSFRNFDTTTGITWSLLNNGHTAQVVPEGELGVSEGGLDSEYLVEQFHFHWGSHDGIGSEHTINGTSFPLELHIVTYKGAYDNLTNAIKFSDGLAVLGVLFEINEAANNNYANLINALQSIKEPDSSTSVPPVPLERLMPANKDQYSRYEGSLTTPPCTQAVIWTLFRDYVSISSQQMEAFRALISADEDNNGNKLPMVNNFRPVQPLHFRKIRANF